MTAAEKLLAAAAILRKLDADATDEEPWPRRDIQQRGVCDSCAATRDLVAAYDDPSGDNEPWLCAGCAALADRDATMRSLAVPVAEWLEEQAGIHVHNSKWWVIALRGFVPTSQRAEAVADAVLREDVST